MVLPRGQERLCCNYGVLEGYGLPTSARRPGDFQLQWMRPRGLCRCAGPSVNL